MVHKTICAIIVGIPKECAEKGFGTKFVSVLLWDVHECAATKYFKVRDIGLVSTPSLLRGHVR